jgi:hypothetical protein
VYELNDHCHRVTTQLQLIKYYYYYYYYNGSSSSSNGEAAIIQTSHSALG